MDALCIVNNHAEILFFTKFDVEAEKSIFSDFISILTSGCDDPPPHMVIRDSEYVYISRDGMYWCCCYKKGSFLSRCGPLLTVDNLGSFHRICVDLIGLITQHTIIANVILLQEIALETMCGGYVQIQDVDKLQSQIYSTVSGPKETSVLNISPGLFGLEKSAPTTAARKSILTLENGKKEVFVDVVEKISATVSAEGILLRADVMGSVILHCLLQHSSCSSLSLTFNSDFSTTPSEGFSPKIQFAEVEFGQSIDISRLHKRELRVATKPGESVILTYTLPPSQPHVLPFELVATHQQLTQSDVELKLKLSSRTGMGTVAPHVVVTMAAPPSTTTIMSRTNGPRNQIVSFTPADRLITWTISDFPGSSYAQAFIRLVDVGEESRIENASLEFEVSKWVPSALRVESIKFQPPLPSVEKWVRYLSASDTVNFRFT